MKQITIEYPRQRILRYLAQCVTLQSIWQMLYNHYRQNVGFVDSRTEFDRKAICKQHIDAWHLDYKSLTLQRALTEEDNREAVPFTEAWARRLEPIYTYRLAKDAVRGDETAFHVLTDLARSIYRDHFNHFGVERFFADKRRNVREYADIILSAIEQQLFTSWREGEYGMLQLYELCEALKQHLEESAAMAYKRAGELRQNVASMEGGIERVLEEVGRMPRLRRTLLEMTGEMQRKYDRFFAGVLDFYVVRTELVSLEFAHDLLQELLRKVYEMGDRLQLFIDILRRMEELAAREANDLLPRDDQPELRDGFIDLSNRRDIESYNKFMCSDEDFIQKMTTQVRTELAGAVEKRRAPMDREIMETVARLQQSLMEAIAVYGDGHSVNARIQDHLHQLSPHFGSYNSSEMSPQGYIEHLYPGEVDWMQGVMALELKEAIAASHELAHVPNVLKATVRQELARYFPTAESLTTVIRQTLQDATGRVFVRLPRVTNEAEGLFADKLSELFRANSGGMQVEIDRETPDMQKISVVMFME